MLLFDTLNFGILLYKYTYYDMPRTSLRLIQNYVNNRTQYINYKNQGLYLLYIQIGIPQGSILVPLFFSIYINDLVNTSKKLLYILYADNTTVYLYQEDFP